MDREPRHLGGRPGGALADASPYRHRRERAGYTIERIAELAAEYKLDLSVSWIKYFESSGRGDVEYIARYDQVLRLTDTPCFSSLFFELYDVVRGFTAKGFHNCPSLAYQRLTDLTSHAREFPHSSAYLDRGLFHQSLENIVTCFSRPDENRPKPPKRRPRIHMSLATDSLMTIAAAISLELSERLTPTYPFAFSYSFGGANGPAQIKNLYERDENCEYDVAVLGTSFLMHLQNRVSGLHELEGYKLITPVNQVLSEVLAPGSPEKVKKILLPSGGFGEYLYRYMIAEGYNPSIYELAEKCSDALALAPFIYDGLALASYGTIAGRLKQECGWQPASLKRCYSMEGLYANTKTFRNEILQLQFAQAFMNRYEWCRRNPQLAVNLLLSNGKFKTIYTNNWLLRPVMRDSPNYAITHARA